MNKRLIDANAGEFITALKEEILPEIRKEFLKGFKPNRLTVYMTREEVCEWLRIDLTTLWRWTKKGVLIGYTIEGRVYYRRDEIDDVIKKGAVKAPSCSI